MKLNFSVWLIFSITPTSFAFEIVCLPCLIGVKALLVKCNLFKKSTYNSYISSPQLGESIILTSLLASRGQLPKIPGLDLPGLPGPPGLAGEDLLPASSLPGLDLDLDPTGLTNVANFPQLPRSAYKRSSRFAFLLILGHAKSRHLKLTLIYLHNLRVFPFLLLLFLLIPELRIVGKFMSQKYFAGLRDLDQLYKGF